MPRTVLLLTTACLLLLQLHVIAHAVTDPGVVYEPDLHRIYPYLALIAFAGIFVLVALRNLMIVKWRCACARGTVLQSACSKALLMTASARRLMPALSCWRRRCICCLAPGCPTQAVLHPAS